MESVRKYQQFLDGEPRDRLDACAFFWRESHGKLIRLIESGFGSNVQLATDFIIDNCEATSIADLKRNNLKKLIL